MSSFLHIEVRPEEKTAGIVRITNPKIDLSLIDIVIPDGLKGVNMPSVTPEKTITASDSLVLKAENAYFLRPLIVFTPFNPNSFSPSLHRFVIGSLYKLTD